jgi:hypothetical protein
VAATVVSAPVTNERMVSLPSYSLIEKYCTRPLGKKSCCMIWAK